MKNLYELPDDLPIPEDDGACDHLIGLRIPSVALESTSSGITDLSLIEGMAVVFFYPMNGKPDSPPMIGWNDIPGARGCTPQVCSFRDDYPRFEKLEVKVFGVSSQPLSDQKEAGARPGLPYSLLNDSRLELAKAMKLPAFEYKGSTFIKRLTIIIEDGFIIKSYYPVFPPDKNVGEVIRWIEHNKNPQPTSFVSG